MNKGGKRENHFVPADILDLDDSEEEVHLRRKKIKKSLKKDTKSLNSSP